MNVTETISAFPLAWPRAFPRAKTPEKGAFRTTLFRKCRDKLMIEDLHFHDARAEALTRLARRVDVLTLARISGHKDLRVLSEHYYRETAADIARRI